MPANEKRDTSCLKVNGQEPRPTHYSKKQRLVDRYINLANLFPPGEANKGSETDVRELNAAWATNWGILPVYASSRLEDRYELFIAVRETLRDVVAAVTEPTLRRPPANSYNRAMVETAEGSTWPRIRVSATQRRSVMLTGRGLVIPEDAYGIFLNVLDSEHAGGMIYDMKFCPVCDLIVLPRRKDQRACSPRCAKTLSVRESRQNKKYRLTRIKSRRLR